MMRSVVGAIACVAGVACGDGDGALLTIRAPHGPASADRLDIVLASADWRAIVDVDGQRAAEASLDEEGARYYRQRTTAGSLDAIAPLDGFALRIEPDASASPDEAFLPFLVALEREAPAKFRVVGIGAVLDAAGKPSPVAIVDGQLEHAVVDLVPLVAATDAIAVGQGRVVTCAAPGGGAVPSGIAWRLERGPQLRLLLPDVATDPAAVDASARPLDLDCDGHEAVTDDCDDLRPAIHAGAPELCDDIDANCDGDPLALAECPL